MRPSPPDPTTVADADTSGTVTVEAPTAEAAIAAIHDSLGASAEIVEAEKVLRGGLWGFFPRQMVQLTARAPDAASEDRRGEPVDQPWLAHDPTDAAPTGTGDLGRVLARLQAEEDAAEEGLGAALRRHLGVTIIEDAPTPAPPTPDPVPAAPPPTAPPPPATAPPLPMDAVEYARADGTPWSGRGLLTLGLPRGFVDAVLAQDPVDDAAWTYAVARALTPLCRPLPHGPAAIVGPRAERFSRALGVPLVRLTGAPRGTASFAAACTDSARARTWLGEHRGSRWTHLVVGGSGWRGLLFDGPLAVSWVGDDMLGEAIRVAHDLGMVLGPGVRDDTAGTLVEPTPIELAMLLRAMLGGRP